jgi:TPR repeat protein
MDPIPAIALAALAALAGCASLSHQADDSFLRTKEFAAQGQPDAQLDLARMYANPAGSPQTRGMQPDAVQAAKWCIIAQARQQPTPAALARGPTCQQILTSLPSDAVAAGMVEADEWVEGTVPAAGG